MKRFKLSLDSFEIVAIDDFNFALYEIRDKKHFGSKKAQGKTKELHGYYGNLASALNKIVNLALLKEDRLNTIQELKEAIIALETQLKDEFANITPSHFKKNTILNQKEGVDYEQQLKPHH